MTVLQLAKSMRPNTGGVSTHIIGLSLELTRRGHTVIVASAGGEYARDLDRHHIDHVTIPFDRAKNPLHALTSLWRLARIVRARRVDIIHCHWRITTIYARVLSAFLSVPFVWSNHSVNIPSRFPYRLFTFPGKAAIAVSSDSHEFLSHGLRIPEKKIHIIHNGIDLTQYTPLTSDEQDRLRARLGVPPHHRVICQVSRLSPAKGQRDLLRAFADLPDARSTTTLILTGKEEGPFRRELLKLAEDLRISGNVIFAGYCVPREILGIADLFVLPSYVEGFPIACVEAMAMKVPVIRTTTGGWSDMKDCCIGVLPGDIDELRRRMEDVVGNRPTMHAMIERAHTFVSRKCSVTEMCREIEHVYST